MPRPRKCRRVCAMPQTEGFVPVCSDGNRETILLLVDEFEVIRLLDLEGLTQEECAQQMDVARATVAGIYESARRKLADAVVHGKALRIGGGTYTVCGQTECRGRGPTCRHWQSTADAEGKKQMKIAVPFENGQIFQHFGKAAQFRLYAVADGKVTERRTVSTEGAGHSALVGFLLGQGVDTLLCGGIGGGAREALNQAGIRLFAGASGDADQAVEALLAGRLETNSEATCGHHGSHGGCGSHGCHGHEEK